MRSKLFAILAVLILSVSLFPQVVLADENGRAVVEDGANLFSSSQETDLLNQLEELTEYGNMGIVTNEDYNSDAAAFARSKYLDIFGETDGTLFLIDMYNRRIQIFSGGRMYRKITKAKANEITDNIYTYASEGNYYKAAQKAFEQIKTVLEGGRLTTPMRYITNALFALGVALLVNFIIISAQRKKNTGATTLTNALHYENRNRKTSAVQGVRSVMTSQTKKRHVQSSGGGGGGFSGGGGGGFSGGGGGGGFSGGGGGHSF